MASSVVPLGVSSLLEIVGLIALVVVVVVVGASYDQTGTRSAARGARSATLTTRPSPFPSLALVFPDGRRDERCGWRRKSRVNGRMGRRRRGRRSRTGDGVRSRAGYPRHRRTGTVSE